MGYIISNMSLTTIQDIFDFFKYDVLKEELPSPEGFSLDKLNLNFTLHRKKGEGLWIEAKDYPGLVASGDTPEELREAVLDSILTYFDVPRATAKRMEDILVLNLPGGVTVSPPLRPKFLEVKVATA